LPEGNEVRRFAELHAKAFAGKTVHVDSPNGRFADAGMLDGRKLKSVEAVGKHLGYVFGRDLTLHVHLGRFGDFTEGKMPLPAVKGVLRLRMWTSRNWLELRGATDITVYTDEKWKSLLARLGPDPLRKGSDPTPAWKVIRDSKTPIGALLMDQSVIAGIGNIYRAELLYRARINPHRAGNQVEMKSLVAIWKDAVALLPQGMVDRRIVTTRPKDRPHPKGIAEDAEVHYVYHRTGKPCWVCGTKIERGEMAGRTAYWCPQCQKD
jgi:endonuclease-8